MALCHSVFPYVVYLSIGPPGNAGTTIGSEHAMDSAPQLLSSSVRRDAAQPWVASRRIPLDRARLLELLDLSRHDPLEPLALQTPPAPQLSLALPLHDHHLTYQAGLWMRDSRSSLRPAKTWSTTCVLLHPCPHDIEVSSTMH